MISKDLNVGKYIGHLKTYSIDLDKEQNIPKRDSGISSNLLCDMSILFKFTSWTISGGKVDSVFRRRISVCTCLGVGGEGMRPMIDFDLDIYAKDGSS